MEEVDKEISEMKLFVGRPASSASQDSYQMLLAIGIR